MKNLFNYLKMFAVLITVMVLTLASVEFFEYILSFSTPSWLTGYIVGVIVAFSTTICINIFLTNSPSETTLQKWLKIRISRTESEYELCTEVNEKINKGAKITVYKEVLEFSKTHPK